LATVLGEKSWYVRGKGHEAKPTRKRAITQVYMNAQVPFALESMSEMELKLQEERTEMEKKMKEEREEIERKMREEMQRQMQDEQVEMQRKVQEDQSHMEMRM